MRKHIVVKSLSIVFVGFLPIAAIAQNDTIKNQTPKTDTTKKVHKKHKWLLGMEVNTALSATSTYNNPDYLYYNDTYGNYTPSSFSSFVVAGNTQTTVKSFSAGIKWAYAIKNNLSLRLCLGMKTNNVFQMGQDTGYSNQQQEITFTQRSYYVNVGCQHDIHLNKYGDMYIGIDASFAYYSNLVYKEFNPLTTNSDNYTTTITGGITTGLGPVIGFNFNLCKHLGLNIEATDELLYEYLGGKETETETYPNNLGSSTHNYNNRVNGFTNSGVVLSIGVLYMH